jgi:hypothetical protein
MAERYAKPAENPPALRLRAQEPVEKNAHCAYNKEVILKNPSETRLMI